MFISANLSVDRHRSGITVRKLARVSPRIVGIAWHRDRYRIPAAEAFVTLCRATAERNLPTGIGMA